MAEQTQPNIFLLAIDSLRADAVYGDHVPTPTFDRLRETGSSFTQCVSTSTTTTPSFSSILTGCYPQRHGVRGLQGYRLSPAVKTLAEILGGHGYATCAEVTGPLLPETGVLRGFHEVHHRPGYRAPFFGWREEVAERMAARSSPWFTLLHLWEVHRPFRIPPTFEKRWDRIGYEGAVTATDERLELLIEAAGDNTIVIVIGDHGEEYPEGPAGVKLVSAARKIRKRLKPARWFPALDRKFQELQVGHGFALREQLVRVPLIFRGPGVPLARIADQVRLIDLTPTVADLCGVPVDEVDGRSLVPLMHGELLPEEPAYIEAVGVKLEGDRIVGVRTPDWKLLKRSDGRSYLYKLNGGGPPNEKRNLYDRYPEVTTALEGYLQRVNDLAGDAGSGMTEDEEAVVEQHLRDLGYL